MRFVLPLLTILMTACGPGFKATDLVNVPVPGPQPDGLVIKGIATVSITSDQESAMHRFFKSLWIEKAYAGSGSASTVVTYNNSPSTTFTINVANLVAGAFSGTTLSLGSVSVTALSDNNLKVCGTGGNQKCTTALISLYTTGSVQGFVNTVDNYGAPVYGTGLNPTTALTLGSPGVTAEQVTGMPNSKHTVTLSDFPSPTYNITSDFSNAGSGSYSMTFVVQYALAP